jgi:hypothetical protein
VQVNEKFAAMFACKPDTLLEKKIGEFGIEESTEVDLV